MKIILTILPGQIAKFLRNTERVGVELTMKFLNGRLDFVSSPLRLALSNKLFLFGIEFIFALHDFNCEVLIVFSHLFTKVTATSMDNQILRAFRVGVDFDEMITAAESADTALKSFGVLEFPEAPKLLEFIEADTASLMHIASTRNELAYSRIEGGIVDFDVAKLHGQHTTANIHTNDVRDNLVT